ncbi:Fibronectin type III domain protein [Trichostrongylus colubriformis]|uniref:Fibronectin type III domain protein n=1 Tax=Trichostrongylus colubriformis TaxID=6319 RepID=A0AAN8F2X1_TRICO
MFTIILGESCEEQDNEISDLRSSILGSVPCPAVSDFQRIFRWFLYFWQVSTMTSSAPLWLFVLVSHACWLINADDVPSVTLNATVDASLSIDVCVNANSSVHSPSSITGFKIYFTRNSIVSGEKFRQWQNIEVLTSETQYCIRLDAHNYDIKPSTVYRLRATVLINQVESSPSKLILLNTKKAASKSPLIRTVKVLVNGSVIFEFLPAEDVDLVSNYTVEYREVTSDDANWTHFNFESDPSSMVLLNNLLPNRTYEARMFVNGHVVHGHRSRTVTFTTNNTAQLPEVKLDPENEIQLDPDVLVPLEVRCDVVATPPTKIFWLVNGQRIQHDHAFYTVTTTTVDDDEQKLSSLMRMKSRTRSDNLTCVAVNPAGQVARSVIIHIRGPGSPPSTVALQNERGGYTVSWLPPSHPNGNITKYVVYHTFNKDDPLSDWQKLVLDGTENSVRVLSKSEDAFYVRVQAAADSGPGVISDIVAIEKDTIPITVSLEYTDPPERQHLLVESREKINVRCVARGKPRPQLFYVLTEVGDDPEAEEDIWQLLEAKMEEDNVVGEVEFSTFTSKTLHCKAKNTAGSNSSSLTFLVKKPGDPPRDIQVLSIDSRDVTIVWKAPKYPNLKIESYELLLSDDVDEDEEYWQKYRFVIKDESLVVTRTSLPTDQLKPSYDYYVKIRAINEAGAGPLSEPIQFTTPNGGPENPPTGVSVDINEANIAVVRWNQPNSTTEILSYVIYFTRDLGLSNEDYREWQTVEVPATQTRYKFDYQVGLKPKTFYRVRVSAKNDVAEGPVSETKEFETAYSELPIPTDIKTRVAEDNSVTITFTAVRDPDDHSNIIQRYKIELAQSDDVLTARWFPVNASTISIDEVTSEVTMSADGEGLAHSRMYWVKITAMLDNPTRFVQASKPRWFRTGDGRLKTRVEIEEGATMEKEPNLFENLRIVCRGEGSPAPNISWFWNDNQVKPDREGWTVKEERVDKKTLSILTRSSVRESGRAVCLATNDNNNATAEIDVRVLGPGSAPRDVHAIGWRNQLNISWDEPSIPNGIIVKYIVYYATRDAADLSEWDKVETDATEIVLQSMSPDTRYLIRVQAATVDGPGIISDAVECYSDRRYEPIEMTLVSVDVPNLEAEPNQTVTFRCTAQGRPIPSLFYSWDNSSEVKIDDVLISEKTYHISGMFETNAVTNRTVLCRAENKHEVVTINRTLIIRKPGDVPANITWMFDENDSLFINWDRVHFPNGNATYILYLSNFVDRVAGPPVRIPEVPYNVNVTLRVSAENEWGEGEKSPPITFPTPHGGQHLP